jgi:hypothetical protein
VKVVEFMAQLFRIEFRGTGSLYTSEHEEMGEDGEKFMIGETFLPPFFMGENILLDIPRGLTPPARSTSKRASSSHDTQLDNSI